MMVTVILRGRFMWRKEGGFALLSAIIITSLLTIAVISHLQTVKSELRLLQLPRAMSVLQ